MDMLDTQLSFHTAAGSSGGRPARSQGEEASPALRSIVQQAQKMRLLSARCPPAFRYSPPSSTPPLHPCCVPAPPPLPELSLAEHDFGVLLRAGSGREGARVCAAFLRAEPCLHESNPCTSGSICVNSMHSTLKLA